MKNGGISRDRCAEACFRWSWGLLVLILAFPAVARAAVSDGALSVVQGTGTFVAISAPIGSVSVGNRRIAHAKLARHRAIYLFGVAKGETDLTVFSQEGKAIASMPIIVVPGGAKAGRRKEDPDSAPLYDVAGDRLVPHRENVPVADASERPQPSGKAADQHGGDGADAISPQVTLKVRFAEVSRSEVQNLGFDWNAVFSPGISNIGLATGGSVGQLAGVPPALGLQPYGTLTGGILGGRVNAKVVLEALESKGVVHTIAEPNLTVKSGHTAKFRAGGDIPVPVPQVGTASTITIEYHPYGVSLEFTPVLTGHNRIALHVVPEVSEISQVNAVNFSGASVPSFTVRRSETDIDLASGQTFAIAGLFQRKLTDADSGLPGVKDIPVIGTLFKSREYQRGETELVILITPYVVEPISETAAALPTEKAGDKLGAPPPPLATERIGFIVD